MQIILQAVARILHVDEGQMVLEIVLKQGEPQHVRWHRGPVGMDELEQLANRSTT